MPTYANKSGLSNVVAWEEGEDWIEVQFGGPAPNRYRYTAESVGRGNLAAMIGLAKAGSGLNAFINKHVRKRYASKR